VAIRDVRLPDFKWESDGKAAGNDLAVATLKTEIAEVAPIRLAESFEPGHGGEAVAVGFSSCLPGLAWGPGPGREIKVPQIGTGALYDRTSAAPLFYFLTDYGDVHRLCPGDSGGPLLLDGHTSPRLVGVAHAIPIMQVQARDPEGKPLTYSEKQDEWVLVVPWRDWIAAATRKQDSSLPGDAQLLATYGGLWSPRAPLLATTINDKHQFAAISVELDAADHVEVAVWWSDQTQAEKVGFLECVVGPHRRCALPAPTRAGATLIFWIFSRKFDGGESPVFLRLWGYGKPGSIAALGPRE
jgi:hypothetical protein